MSALQVLVAWCLLSVVISPVIGFAIKRAEARGGAETLVERATL